MAHPLFDAKSYPWHIAEAKALHDILSVTIQMGSRIQQAYEQCGPGLQFINAGNAPDVVWREVLNNLVSVGRLRVLCDNLLDSMFPKVKEIIYTIKGMKDVVERTILNQEGLLFLDRKDFRAYLEMAAGDENMLKIIVVRGAARSGRSWTRHLVESVARARGEAVLYFCRDNLSDLDTLVSDLFEYFEADKPASLSSDAANYGNICTKLANAARQSKKRCWLTVDDLDSDSSGNPLIDVAIRDFFEQFARVMISPHLREWFRLVLLAYPAQRPMPSRWAKEHFRVDETRSDAIGETHVFEHLEAWAASKGRALAVEERVAIGRRIISAADQARADERLTSLRDALEGEIAKLGGVR